MISEVRPNLETNHQNDQENPCSGRG
jgi:hypothetical protein